VVSRIALIPSCLPLDKPRANPAKRKVKPPDPAPHSTEGRSPGQPRLSEVLADPDIVEGVELERVYRISRPHKGHAPAISADRGRKGTQERSKNSGKLFLEAMIPNDKARLVSWGSGEV